MYEIVEMKMPFTSVISVINILFFLGSATTRLSVLSACLTDYARLVCCAGFV